MHGGNMVFPHDGYDQNLSDCTFMQPTNMCNIEKNDISMTKIQVLKKYELGSKRRGITSSMFETSKKPIISRFQGTTFEHLYERHDVFPHNGYVHHCPDY